MWNKKTIGCISSQVSSHIHHQKLRWSSFLNSSERPKSKFLRNPCLSRPEKNGLNQVILLIQCDRMFITEKSLEVTDTTNQPKWFRVRNIFHLVLGKFPFSSTFHHQNFNLIYPAPQKKGHQNSKKNILKRHLVWLGLQVLRGKISPKTTPRLQFGERGVIFLGGFFFPKLLPFFLKVFFCWLDFFDVQKIRKANNFSYILVRLVFRIKLHGTNH